MGLSQTQPKTYINVESGFLCVSKGPGNEPVKYDTITGFLGGLTDFKKMVGKDPNRREKHALHITLIDGDDEYILEAGIKTTFSKMFAGCLADIEPGECIRIRVKSNDREPKSTSCFVEKQVNDRFVKAEYNSFKGAEVDVWLDVIRKHNAYRAYKPFVGDPSKAESYRDQFFMIAGELGWPDAEEHPGAYYAWISRMLQGQYTDRSALTEQQWGALAARAAKHQDPQAPIPKEFRDLMTKAAPVATQPAIEDDYDPFADE